MKYYLPMIAAASLGLLSACGSSNDEPEIVGGPADPMAKELANAAAVELPPSVKNSFQYRCKDNSLLFIDFMSDDKTALVRTEKSGTPTRLVAAEAGQSFTADGGYEVTGNGKQITAALAGGPEQSCKA